MSEVRLIDANALISKMVNEPVKAVDGVDFDTEWFTRIADTAVQFTDMVENAPTVDAVQVVANDRNKLCPINHGLRCKDIDNCAFWCEWGQCAVKAIAVACTDGERL